MNFEKGVAFYGNPKQNAYIDRIAGLLDRVRRAGMKPYINREFADYLCAHGLQVGGEAYDEFPADRVDTLVSIGGDGTFLRAAQWCGKSEVPMMGINTGHLGFLANFSFNDMEEIIDTLEKKTRCMEQRMVLKVKCAGMPADFYPYALNEVAMLKMDSASMVTVHTKIDGAFLADYQCDGMIVATPTGSTAYNMSVGGPILEPTVSNMVISPIAPHSLTMRPLVIGGESEVRAEVRCAVRKCRISLDGRTFTLPCLAKHDYASPDVVITKAPFVINVIRRRDGDFSAILRDKLLWGKR